MKEQDIMNGDWDNLIILDACRYDFFKKAYKDYVEGKLEKRISRGSGTTEWLYKNFKLKYDLTYISANPYINSRGIPIDKLHNNNYSWKATEHFTKIVDVWNFGWDKALKTVPPDKVNEAVLKHKKDNSRTIIHYIQPHRPYVGIKIKKSQNRRNKVINEAKKNSGISRMLNKTNQRIFSHIPQRYIDNYFVKVTYWKIKQFLGVKPSDDNEFEILWRHGGIKSIYGAYEENLKIALEAVSQITNNLEGRTVITSDHGEAWGENAVWGHPENKHIPVLIEVPWLDIL